MKKDPENQAKIEEHLWDELFGPPEDIAEQTRRDEAHVNSEAKRAADALSGIKIMQLAPREVPYDGRRRAEEQACGGRTTQEAQVDYSAAYAAVLKAAILVGQQTMWRGRQNGSRIDEEEDTESCLLYTSPSPRD